MTITIYKIQTTTILCNKLVLDVVGNYAVILIILRIKLSLIGVFMPKMHGNVKYVKQMPNMLFAILVCIPVNTHICSLMMALNYRFRINVRLFCLRAQSAKSREFQE